MVAPGARAWSHLFRRAAPLALGAGGWLILAPHPDDEVLGAGALIATLEQAGVPVRVVFLTDGAGSHVGAPGWSPARVARLRRGEARAAVAMLGAGAAVHLDWGDGAPMKPDEPGFEEAVRRLVALCRRERIGQVAVTWGGDPHCDHEAAAVLAEAVARRAGARLFEYLVWGWTVPALTERVAASRAWRVATAAARPTARRAMAAHRSQRGGRIAGGVSFRLPPGIMRLLDRPATILLERRRAP